MPSIFIETQLNYYLQRLSEAEKWSLVQLIKTFAEGKSQSQISLDANQYNQEIDEAMDDYNNGRFISQAEMERGALKW